jgi:hypothetical protein
LMTGGRGTQPSPIVLLDSLNPVMLGVTLHVSLPKSMLGSHHIIFPCHEGTLPLVQSPLLYMELLLQLDDHPQRNSRI